MTVLLQQTEFPLRTVYNIEQLRVILKSRVWVAEEEAGQHGDFDKSNYRAVNRHSRNLKNGILKGRQCRRRSHRSDRIQLVLTTRVKTDGNEGWWEGIHATRNSTHGDSTQQYLSLLTCDKD
jgi:hypothetical protein